MEALKQALTKRLETTKKAFQDHLKSSPALSVSIFGFLQAAEPLAAAELHGGSVESPERFRMTFYVFLRPLFKEKIGKHSLW